MGFPIQKSTDQSLFDSSPWHIAAFHVFHRLPAPRHPPLALSSLNYMNTLQLRLLYNFQKAKKTFSQLSRNISLYRQPVIDLRKYTTSDLFSILLRKEVIQPHVPVRLPCYDLVPVTDPTLDSFFPKGLDHWLRVLPTSVT